MKIPHKFCVIFQFALDYGNISSFTKVTVTIIYCKCQSSDGVVINEEYELLNWMRIRPHWTITIVQNKLKMNMTTGKWFNYNMRLIFLAWKRWLVHLWNTRCETSAVNWSVCVCSIQVFKVLLRVQTSTSKRKHAIPTEVKPN